MDFFDELDQAFDNILSGPEEESQAGQVEAEPHHDLHHLKDAIAEEKLKPISALGALLPKAPRRIIIPALVGALNHLKSLKHNEDHLQIIEQLNHLMRTKAGAVRKKLSKPLPDQIQERIVQLAGHANESSTREVRELLAICGSEPGSTIETLFTSGLWSASLLNQAPPSEVVHITGLELSLVERLKSP